jgi:hypothetical protein
MQGRDTGQLQMQGHKSSYEVVVLKAIIPLS